MAHGLLSFIRTRALRVAAVRPFAEGAISLDCEFILPYSSTDTNLSRARNKRDTHQTPAKATTV